MSRFYGESPRKKVLERVACAEFRYWFARFLECGHGTVDRSVGMTKHCRLCRMMYLDDLTEEERAA